MSAATMSANEPALKFIGGDKITETMVSREVMLGMLVLYLGMIGGLRVWMKNRPPFSLKLAMQVGFPTLPPAPCALAAARHMDALHHPMPKWRPAAPAKGFPPHPRVWGRPAHALLDLQQNNARRGSRARQAPGRAMDSSESIARHIHLRRLLWPACLDGGHVAGTSREIGAMAGRGVVSEVLILHQVYNVAQVALNIYMIWGLAVVPQLPTNIFGINLAYNARIEWFVYVHYLSKFLDFFDTLFIILRGKDKEQLSFLHVYHHASIGMIWGTLLYIGHGNGTAVRIPPLTQPCDLTALTIFWPLSHLSPSSQTSPALPASPLDKYDT